MKNLDFNKNGLQELSNQEMSELEGGALFRATGFIGFLFGGNSWSEVEFELFGIQLK